MMKVRVILCIVGALLVHLAVICFGGILFLEENLALVIDAQCDGFFHFRLIAE